MELTWLCFWVSSQMKGFKAAKFHLFILALFSFLVAFGLLVFLD